MGLDGLHSDDGLRTQAANTDVLIVRRASAETSALDVNKVQVQSNRAQATVFTSATAPPATARDRPQKRAT